MTPRNKGTNRKKHNLMLRYWLYNPKLRVLGLYKLADFFDPLTAVADIELQIAVDFHE